MDGSAHSPSSTESNVSVTSRSQRGMTITPRSSSTVAVQSVAVPSRSRATADVDLHASTVMPHSGSPKSFTAPGVATAAVVTCDAISALHTARVAWRS
jgi:hypothetical protein